MTWYCAHIVMTTRPLDGGEMDVGPVEERIFLIEAADLAKARMAAVDFDPPETCSSLLSLPGIHAAHAAAHTV